MWTQSEAITLCRVVESVAPSFGCHVALTGGLLYKDGPRKDCDTVFYRIRQADAIEIDNMFRALSAFGVVRVTTEHRFCVKATWGGKPVDCFFPEFDQGEYADDEE